MITPKASRFKEDKRRKPGLKSKSTFLTSVPSLSEKPKYGLKENPLEAVIEDLDSSFDFKEETKQHQKLFHKKAKFSYL
jgi:hypothetical protein